MPDGDAGLERIGALFEAIADDASFRNTIQKFNELSRNIQNIIGQAGDVQVNVNVDRAVRDIQRMQQATQSASASLRGLSQGFAPSQAEVTRVSQLGANFQQVAQGITLAQGKLEAFIRRLQGITLRADILGDPFQGFEQRLEAVRAKILATSQELANVINVPAIAGDPFIQQIQRVQEAIGVFERVGQAKSQAAKIQILNEADPELLREFGINAEDVLTGQVQPAVERLQGTLRDLFARAPEEVFPDEQRLQLLQQRFNDLDGQYQRFAGSSATVGIRSQILQEQMQLLNQQIRLQGRVTPELEESYNRIQREMIEVSSSADLVRSRWGAALSSIQNFTVLLRSQLAFYAGIGILFGTIFKIRQLASDFGEFEQVLKNVGAISAATDAELRRLEESVRQVALTTSLSATEVADGIRILVQAGLTIVEATQAIEAVAKTAILTSEDIGDVSNLLVTALKAFNIEADRSEDVLNIFAGALNFSRLSINDMATAMNYLGATMKTAGFGLSDAAAAMAVLSNAGIKASTIGTGLTTLLSNLLAPTKEFRDELERLAKARGIDDILDKLNPANAQSIPKILEGLTEIGFDLTSIFETIELRGARALTVSLSQGAEAFEVMKRRIEETDQVAAGFARSMESVGSQVALANNQLIDAAITFGETLAPSVIFFANSIRNLINGLNLLAPVLATATVAIGAMYTALFGIPAILTSPFGIIAGFALLGSTVLATIGYFNRYTERLEEASLRARAQVEIQRQQVFRLEDLNRAIDDGTKSQEDLKNIIEELITDYPTLGRFLDDQIIKTDQLREVTDELIKKERERLDQQRQIAEENIRFELANAVLRRAELEANIRREEQLLQNAIERERFIGRDEGQIALHERRIERFRQEINEINQGIQSNREELERLEGVRRQLSIEPLIVVDPSGVRRALEAMEDFNKEIKKLDIKELESKLRLQFRVLGAQESINEIRIVQEKVLAIINELERRRVSQVEKEFQDTVKDFTRTEAQLGKTIQNLEKERQDELKRGRQARIDLLEAELQDQLQNLATLGKARNLAEEKFAKEKEEIIAESENERVRLHENSNKQIQQIDEASLSAFQRSVNARIRTGLRGIDQADTLSEIRAIENELLRLNADFLSRQIIVQSQALERTEQTQEQFNQNLERIFSEHEDRRSKITAKGLEIEEKQAEFRLKINDELQTALLDSELQRILKQSLARAQDAEKQKFDTVQLKEELLKIDQRFAALYERNRESILRDQSESNIRAVRTFQDAIQVGIEESSSRFKSFNQEIAEDISQTIGGISDTFKNQLGDAIASVIVNGENFKERFTQIMRQIASEVISLTIRTLILKAVFESIGGFLEPSTSVGGTTPGFDVNIPARKGGLLTKYGIRRFAEGGFAGHIPGYGGGDRVPAILEQGEYVQPKESVLHYGLRFMEAVRKLELPKMDLSGIKMPTMKVPRMHYQTGGPVGSSRIPFSNQNPVEVTILNISDPREIQRVMARTGGKNVILNTVSQDYRTNGVTRRLKG